MVKLDKDGGPGQAGAETEMPPPDDSEFYALANHLPTLCWMAQADGSIFWYNRRWYAYTGTSPESQRGWGWESVHDPKSLPKVIEQWRYSIATGEPFAMTFPLRGADGVFRSFLTRVEPLRNEAGAVVRWFGTNVDISAQVAAEAVLRESEAQFRTFAQAMPNHVWTSPASGLLNWFNDQVYTYSGASPGELDGQNWAKIVHPEDLAAAAERWATSLATQQPYQTEFRLRRADGVYRWHIARAVPIESADGSAPGWIGTNTDIEDQKQVSGALAHLNANLEKQVAERTRELSRTWEVSPDILGILNFDGYFETSNPAWQAILGWSKEEIRTTKFFDFIHPDDLARTYRAWDEAQAGEPALRFENRYRRKQGGWRWLSWVAVPERNKVYCSARDITVEKDQASALAESRADRDRLWRLSTDLMIVADFEATIVAVNPAWFPVTGWGEGELVGRSFMELVHDDDRPASLAELEKLSRGAKTFKFENRFRRKDGSYCTLDWTAVPDERFIHAIGRDVTEANHAAAALQLAESRIRAVFDTTDQFQGFMTPEGTLLSTNPASLAAIEERAEDVIGHPFWETPWFSATPGMSEMVKDGVAAAAVGRLVRRELTLNLPTGRRSFDFSMRPVSDGSGRVIGIVPEAAETTERRKTEDALRQAQKMEAVGQLTGGIAHDFNNMIAVVIGSLNLIERRLAKGEDVQKFLDSAMEGAERAAALTHRLLAFSRQLPLAPQAVDANRLVGNVSEMLRRTLGETTPIETVLAGGLWKINADAGQIESAIVNLAINARDAMPEGGKVTIETANCHLDDAYAQKHQDVSAGQYVMIAVSDAGTGMPSDVVEKAFEPFFTTKGVGKGTGLGLSQVYGFVKQSHGHIKIYSEVGHGTAVKIYLPRLYGAAEQAGGVLESHPVTPMGSSADIILVVEDDDRMREISAAGLRELGYTVMHAASGAIALEILAAYPKISVLFTDIVMPDMNGRKLADEALKLRPDLKIVFTTGYTRNAVVHNGVLDAGVNFLTKPFTLDQLAKKIRQVIGRG